MTKSEIKENLGKQVESSTYLKREFGKNGYEWKPQNRRTKKIRGVLMGSRTLRTGARDQEDGSFLFTKGTVEAALIIVHYRENPIHVPLEDCELVIGGKVNKGGDW